MRDGAPDTLGENETVGVADGEADDESLGDADELGAAETSS